jgi:hypothetical protein
LASTPENQHLVSVTLTFDTNEETRPDVVMHRVLTSVIHANLPSVNSISAHLITLDDDVSTE